MGYKQSLNSLLSDVDFCPVCGEKSTHSMSVSGHSPGSNRYTLALCERLGIEEEELLKSLQLLRCSNCKSTYYNPFLSLEARSILYNKAYPIHNVGWLVFDNYMGFRSDSTIEEHFLRRERILALLREVTFVGKYAEMICPMNGLFPLLLKPKKNASLRKSKRRIMLEFLEAFRKLLELCSRYVGFFDIVHAMHTKLLFRMKKRFAYDAVIFNDLSFDEDRFGKAVSAYLIDCPSSMIWKNHCNKWGFHCSAFSEFSIPISLLSDFPRFDCIGLFNVLDHIEKPFDVLRLLLENAKFIFIESHSSGGAGAQHAFFLTNEFFMNLSFLIPGVAIKDVSQRILMKDADHRDTSYYIISTSENIDL